MLVCQQSVYIDPKCWVAYFLLSDWVEYCLSGPFFPSIFMGDRD